MMIYLQLFATFFEISLFSIGGGYNMIPLMQHAVTANGWLSAERFLDILAVSEITPGPIAVNLATFAGYHTAGFWGAVAATVAVCLPGSVILLVLGSLAFRLRDRPAFRAAMRGLMPALVGLLTATALRLATALIPAGAHWPSLQASVVFAVALTLFLWKNLHPAVLMLGAAATGVAWSLVA
ncbi:MAG TPA: chromate transporter [Kiritimatiellia bacterium]|jgi:chromate transporter|nr:MAG: Chromate transport protein [Verrucomicrobia bacterium ADurb.Bin018]HOD99430.1 chromate transporter [Kiritimatiellia bacterium]HOE36083.1 chromate transporter [Kiritimatiellia bacterium]HOR73507.1 chromate transporter [Kiritimatiellia bacterium]HOU58103.1 chromate transporter [Kiritimatiellia bacterium]